jgi:uncharacterized protein YbaA (DUF1428 family)
MTPDATDQHEGYVDIYLLPVREDRLDAYRDQAMTFGKVARELGALGYREFVSDDTDTAFTAEAGMVMTAAVAEFRSRAHRDEVMQRVIEDPRVKALLDGEEVAEMSQMRYGGFRTFVDPQAA